MTESDPEKLERTLAGGLRLPDNCVEEQRPRDNIVRVLRQYPAKRPIEVQMGSQCNSGALRYLVQIGAAPDRVRRATCP